MGQVLRMCREQEEEEDEQKSRLEEEEKEEEEKERESRRGEQPTGTSLQCLPHIAIILLSTFRRVAVPKGPTLLAGIPTSRWGDRGVL